MKTHQILSSTLHHRSWTACSVGPERKSWVMKMWQQRYLMLETTYNVVQWKFSKRLTMPYLPTFGWLNREIVPNLTFRNVVVFSLNNLHSPPPLPRSIHLSVSCPKRDTEGQGQPPGVHRGTGSASRCTQRDRVSLPVYTEGQGQLPSA